MPFGIVDDEGLKATNYVIDAQNLVKVYRKRESTGSWLKDIFFPGYTPFKAVDGVSLKIKKGETFGLLGPNGSGKTTLIKMLTGLLLPDQGRIMIDGRGIERSLNKIGVMFGFTMIYYRMSGYANLKYVAKLYKVKNYRQRINELSRMLGLGEWMNTYVENYSLGMKCKLALARALISDPEILFLDEPTLGLDPKISLAIREEIKDMNKTVILTTHYMDEANALCDRIGIIRNGKIVRVGTPAFLKRLISENVIINIGLTYFGNTLIDKLRKQGYVHNVALTRDGLRVHIENKSFLPSLLSLLADHKIVSINEEEPTLVDVFIRLTGGQ